MFKHVVFSTSQTNVGNVEYNLQIAPHITMPCYISLNLFK